MKVLAGERDTVRTRINAGDLLDQRYDVIEVVDDASSGIVCRAVDRHANNRPVVLKVLHADLAGQPRERERFILEGGLALTSNRGKLVSQVVGSGLIDNRVPYMAVEDVPGRSLQKLIKENPNGIEPEYSLTIGIRICEAVAELHKRNIVHRDLKPTTLQIVNADVAEVEIRILEFGLARFVASSRRADTLTKTGVIVGTAAEYMSPEQCRGMLVDQRADIYSVGCILYEMLSGRQPFTGDSPAELMHHQLSSPPPDLTGHPCLQKYPRLEQVLWRAMAKKRGERYFSASDLAADLQALLDNTALRPFEKSSDDEVCVSSVPSVSSRRESDRQSLGSALSWDSLRKCRKTSLRVLLPVLAFFVAVTVYFLSTLGGADVVEVFTPTTAETIAKLNNDVGQASPQAAAHQLLGCMKSSTLTSHPRELLVLCVKTSDRLVADQNYLLADQVLNGFIKATTDSDCHDIAWLKLGDMYMRIGRADQSVLYLKKVGDIRRADDIGMIRQASLASFENISDAANIYHLLLKRSDLSPFENIVLSRKLANCQTLEGLTSEAEQTLEAGLRRMPTNEKNLSLRYQIDSAKIELYFLQVKKQPSVVVENATKLINLNRFNQEQLFEAFRLRANAYEELNDLPHAEEDLLRAVKFRSGPAYQYEEVLLSLSGVQSRLGKTESASAYRKEAFEIAVRSNDLLGASYAAPAPAAAPSTGEDGWSMVGAKDNLDFAAQTALLKDHLLADRKAKRAKSFAAQELGQLLDERWKNLLKRLSLITGL